MPRLLILLMFLTASPAQADMTRLVADHVLPRHEAFARSTAALARAAEDTCDPGDLAPAYHAAYDDWLGLQPIRVGPIEEDGRGLAIAFWPDPKGLGLKAQRALLEGDPARLEPQAFAQQSVAARGLTGLERLLFPQEPWPGETCSLIRATSADLARLAAELRDGWHDDFGPLLLSAGEPGNPRFLTQTEARQVMFTQVITALEYLKDQRLGRPMGSFDRPAPERAEARASGRSLRNVTLSLGAIRDMVATLSDKAPDTLAALDRAIELAQALPDPVLAGVSTPQGRLRIEILQQAVDAARQTALDELGPALGVTVGFNAMDGD
ncbi:imelysin family protein [Paracoccus sp. (in: a-proteobacteria)]|uniref:imelysin family protein n=1 Tax=Paracoccus sp. TaxID=267 RepID=UPI00396C4BDA